MSNKSRLFSLLFFSSFSMMSFAAVPTLQQALEGPLSRDESKSSVNAMRYEALHSTGLEYGLQAGLAYQYDSNMKRLDSLSEMMEKTYPFQSMMMEGNVVPPVISEVIGVYDQQSSTSIRLADKERTIIAAPRFSFAAPSYRDYFIHDFSFSASGLLGLTPKGPDELLIWKAAVTEGYAAGRAQALQVFSDDTARLARDFNGMRLYHQLLSAGKVTRPYVAVAHTAVTGDKDSTMKEGESLLQISASPEFVMNSKEWNVELAKSIQSRLAILVDPVDGGKMVSSLGISRETKSLSLRKKPLDSKK